MRLARPRRWAKGLATALAAVVTLSALGLLLSYPWFRDLVLAVTAGDEPRPVDANPVAALVTALLGLAWAWCGWVIVQRTGNLVGWVVLVVGLCIGPLWLSWAYWALVVVQDVHLGAWARLLADGLDFTWLVAVVLMGIVLPLVFPSGRPPSPRWHWVWAVAALALVGGIVAVDDARRGWSPHSVIGALGAMHWDVFYDLGDSWTLFALPMLLGAGGAVASLLARLRAAGPVERRQAMWVAAALGVVGAMVAAAFLGQLDRLMRSETGPLLVLAAYALIPLSVVAAILRYRLFEIDRLLSRTVSYALVIGLLGAVYAGLVIGLRRLVGGESDLVVALSTLVVAFLFLPLLRRVQRQVDRRFFRSRYDAAAVVARMAEELRGRLDLADLGDRSAAVVDQVFSPESVVVWVADAGRRNDGVTLR